MYFSVNTPLRMGNKKCIPCICYEITESNKATVENLAEKGKAVIHKDFVFFQNGKILEKKEVKIVEEKPVSRKAKKSKIETLEPVDEQVENEGF